MEEQHGRVTSMRAAASARSASAPIDLQLKRSLLRNLNETVSLASRRVFQTRLLHSHSSLSAIREHLPELCAFADSLFHGSSTTGSKGSGSSTTCAQRHAATVRRVFKDPEAQWLARSAVQSGVTALMCGQLIRCAEERFAAKQDASVARLVLLLLCDQLFVSCTGAASGSCEWRDRKPAYHSMHCFSIWDTLLPFLERMAKRFPHVLERVLSDFATVQPVMSGWKGRVNCDFAHIVGLWGLMEAVGGSKGDAQPVARVVIAVGEPTDEAQGSDAMLLLCSSVLRYMVRSMLMKNEANRNEDQGGEKATESEVKSAAFYDDLLMEKFFSGLQEFMFYCPRSKRIARAALCDSIVALIARPTEDTTQQDEAAAARLTGSLVPPRLAVFAAVSSLFVNGLVGDIMSNLLDHLHDETTTPRENGVLDFFVGLAAHVGLVPMNAVLQLFDALLDIYTSESERDTRISVVYYIVYVALHRIDALHAFRGENRTSSAHEDSQSSSPYLALLTFQGRFCGEIESADFYALPLEWMELLWKEWFELSSDEITSFVTDCEAHHDEVDDAIEGQETPASPDSLTKCKERIPFRNLSELFPRQLKLLNSHYIASGRVDNALLASGVISEDQNKRAFLDGGMPRSRKKMRRAIALVDPEAEERKLNVLMLPEVMERVCSFMSAKRLCRLAVVCKAFAEISRSDRLWQQLWIGLTSRDLEPVQCRHGVKYVHDWRLMYRKRWDARRRLRKRLRMLQASSSQRLQDADLDSTDFVNDFNVNGDELTAQLPFAARICAHCDCYERFHSQAQMDEHMQRHEKFQCSDRESCGASFTSATQLNKHQKAFHPVLREKKEAVKGGKERVPCSHEGCSKTYMSLKRLESHRKTHDPVEVPEPLIAAE